MSQASRQADSKSFKRLQMKFGNFGVKYAWVAQRGYYPEDLSKANQDCHGEHENFCSEEGAQDCHLFAVYDGHGSTGDFCAQFARDKWPPLLKAALKETKDEPSAAFKSSLVQVNADLHKDESIDDSLSGTTCIAVLFQGGTIHVANIGDSRATPRAGPRRW